MLGLKKLTLNGGNPRRTNKTSLNYKILFIQLDWIRGRGCWNRKNKKQQRQQRNRTDLSAYTIFLLLILETPDYTDTVG